MRNINFLRMTFFAFCFVLEVVYGRECLDRRILSMVLPFFASSLICLRRHTLNKRKHVCREWSRYCQGGSGGKIPLMVLPFFMLSLIFLRQYPLSKRITLMVLPFLCVFLNLFTTTQFEQKEGCLPQVKPLYTAVGGIHLMVRPFYEWGCCIRRGGAQEEGFFQWHLRFFACNMWRW